jgi:hypothetical protein
LLCHNASAFSIAGVPIIVDPKIAFRCPSKLAQGEFKCRNAGQRFRIGGGNDIDHADAAHAVGLLRPRRERPRRRAAEQRDEIAPPHVGHEPASRPRLTTAQPATKRPGSPSARS